MLVQQHLTAKKNQNKTTENKVNQNKIFFFPLIPLQKVTYLLHR